MNLRRVREDRRRIRRHGATELDARGNRRAQQVLHFGDEGRERNGAALAILLATEGHQAFDEVARPMRSAANLLHAAPAGCDSERSSSTHAYSRRWRLRILLKSWAMPPASVPTASSF